MVITIDMTSTKFIMSIYVSLQTF